MGAVVVDKWRGHAWNLCERDAVDCCESAATGTADEIGHIECARILGIGILGIECQQSICGHALVPMELWPPTELQWPVTSCRVGISFANSWLPLAHEQSVASE